MNEFYYGPAFIVLITHVVPSCIYTALNGVCLCTILVSYASPLNGLLYFNLSLFHILNLASDHVVFIRCVRFISLHPREGDQINYIANDIF